MELIDKDRLRETLLYQHAKYLMSEHLQNKHTSAGFMLSVVELDGQPVVDAIPVSWLKEYMDKDMVRYGTLYYEFERMLDRWERERRTSNNESHSL